MSNQEKTWWRKLEKEGNYIMLTPSGKRGVAQAWGGPSGQLYVEYRLYIGDYTTDPPGPDCLFYGPFEAGEIFDALWSELPEPPKRLPKAHPDRYLGRIATVENWDARGEVYVTAGKEDDAGYISISWCKAQIPGTCLARCLSYIPGRYAQQDPQTGIWHEVDASEDPWAQQKEEEEANA